MLKGERREPRGLEFKPEKIAHRFDNAFDFFSRELYLSGRVYGHILNHSPDVTPIVSFII